MARIHTGNVELEYATLGDSTAPTLVLIRGLGTQMIEWSPRLLDGLVAAGFHVVTFDNRDAGLSDKAVADYALADMAADVIGLMDGLAIERAGIFGISLGGMVAQLVAFHYPERVTCLFSVMSSSGDPALPQPTPEIRARLLQGAEGRDAVIALNAENRVAFGSPGYPEPADQRLAAAAAAHDRCHYPPGVARQMRAVMADGSRVARLQQIRVPTLVIHGADDPLIPLAAGRDTARHIPGAALEVVAGMGHNLPDALVPTLVALVSGFVARQSGSQRPLAP
jgi:pimeloyl-ACP methyl ester carboxylesterase